MWHLWIGEASIWETKFKEWSSQRVLTVKQNVISSYLDCPPCPGIIIQLKLEWLNKPKEYLKGAQLEIKYISKSVSNKDNVKKEVKITHCPPPLHLLYVYW